MNTLWFALALAQPMPESTAVAPCPLEVARYLEAVRDDGIEEAYLCLITVDDFKAPLVEMIKGFPPDSKEDNRLTRALALHLAARADAPFDRAEVKLLNAADRRLLADAIKARRGRRSPSAEHEAVFAKQPWYRPRDRFTNNMLSDIEKQNVKLANNPDREPELSEAPPMMDATAPSPPPLQQPPASPPPPEPEGCGCQGGPAPLALALLAPLWWRRRARSPTRHRWAGPRRPHSARHWLRD